MAKIKVMVSKRFAKFINDTAKELGFEVSAEVVSLSENAYKWNVTMDYDNAYENGDYDWNSGEFKAIMLTYPETYYAMPQYLTTHSLNKEFVRMGVQSADDLKRMIRQMCEI